MKTVLRRISRTQLRLPATAAAGLWAFTSLLATQTPASVRALDELLNSRKRPTMQQVIDAMMDRPRDLGAYVTDERFDHRRLDQIPNLATVIAFMEKTYPGAIWAPLGRDAVIFGDLLDAFYLAIGQQGRVVRLNASGASFGAQEPAANELRVKLLESAGLNLKDISARTVVGLDRTNYTAKSQSTNLIRAGYQAYDKRGGRIEEMVPYLSFMGLAGNLPTQDFGPRVIENYFKGISVAGGSLSEVIQLPIGLWTDSTAWHDTFGALQENEEGQVEGAPGAPTHAAYRREILTEMIKIYQQVSKPAFIRSVQKVAQERYGYRFPMDERECDEMRDSSWPARQAAQRLLVGREELERVKTLFESESKEIAQSATSAQAVIDWWDGAVFRANQANGRHHSDYFKLKPSTSASLILSALPSIEKAGHMPEKELDLLVRTILYRLGNPTLARAYLGGTEDEIETDTAIIALYRKSPAFRKILARQAKDLNRPRSRAEIEMDQKSEVQFAKAALDRLRSKAIALSPLLDRPKQPSMTEILQYGAALPMSQPETAGMDGNAIYFAQLVAFLEGTYPGATWVITDPVVERLGDSLEAFYASIGQTGRVVRLALPKDDPKFSRLENDQKQWERVKLMEAKGLELLNEHAKPFILLGSSPLNPGTEPYGWLKSIYDVYHAVGGSDQSEPFTRFNYIQFDTSDWQTQPGLQRESYFAELKARNLTFPQPLVLTAFYRYWPRPERDVRALQSWEVANPSSAVSEANNTAILNEAFATVELLSSRPFLAEVLRQAKFRGFMFPTTELEQAGLREAMKARRRSSAFSKRISKFANNLGAVLSRDPGLKRARQIQARAAETAQGQNCAEVFERAPDQGDKQP